VRGNPHAAFDVAGAGNVAWSRWCDTRRRKGETTGNTNFDLHRRASPRPTPPMSGMWKRVRHRQTKEAATDMFSLQPPRHISTLPECVAKLGCVCDLGSIFK
jgi:hypothetical protein